MKRIPMAASNACSTVLNVNASMWSYDIFCVAKVRKKNERIEELKNENQGNGFHSFIL